MNSFTTHKGTPIIIDRANIDTDQIIPKEHLKSIKRTGFESTLFSDWRYLDDGSDNPNFELNSTQGKNATILITGNNFGCGSSREHAVWAVVQYGFRAVIAPQKKEGENTIPAFADIFRNNSLKNGLLLIELGEEQISELKTTVQKNPDQEIEIDLEQQKITHADLKLNFETDPAVRERLLKGLDDIGITLGYEEKIREFEERTPCLPASTARL